MNIHIQACDTCYSRKIKCDMAKPVCSNCQLYKVRCTTTLIRRRAMASKPKSRHADVSTLPRDNESDKSNSHDQSLEARLKGIEARLDSIGAAAGGDSSSLASLMGYSPMIDAHDFSSNVVDMNIFEPSYVSEPVVTSSGSGASSTGADGFPELPPLHEALPVIETYFDDFNGVLPLHHQPTFMKLLHRCYSGPEQQRQRVEFALVHSVLAIGYRLRPNNNTDGGVDDGGGGGGIFVDTTVPYYRFAEDRSQQCMRNCERLLNDLVTRDEDTLGIQALLALVVLHLSNGDDKSASMLISAAMRLAHSLQIHTKSSDSSFPLREAQQRHNIFWICYCLDKDISLKTSTPSVQLNSDIDLDLPGATTSSASPEENMFGIMEQHTEGENGQQPPPQFHYLRARVQLAFIEGQIYDGLYSVRSLKKTPEQRRQEVARLDALLATWGRFSLPPSPDQDVHQQFTADDGDYRGDNCMAASLNHTYLFCLFSLHGLYSWESVWVQNIDILGRTALENFSNKSEKCMHSLQPPIPDAWNKCVLASRRSVQLIISGCRGRERHTISNNNNNNNTLWFSTCLLFSALVILLVNITYEPGHKLAVRDRQLAAEAAVILKSTMSAKDETASAALVNILRGLELAADKWTGYYELDPTSIQPPPPAKGYDLFGNGIVMMAASGSASSSSDPPLLDESATGLFTLSDIDGRVM
ncbi:hypothetical protein PG989_014129 [Apiospora arundinis]